MEASRASATGGCHQNAGGGGGLVLRRNGLGGLAGRLGGLLDRGPVSARSPGFAGVADPNVICPSWDDIVKNDRGHKDARGLGRVGVVAGVRSRGPGLESARLASGF